MFVKCFYCLHMYQGGANLMFKMFGGDEVGVCMRSRLESEFLCIVLHCSAI